MDNKSVFFPYYSGNIKLTKPMGYVSLERFIKVHKQPLTTTVQTMEKIKKCTDPKEKRKLKHKLYSFTPSCIIREREKRMYANIDRYTGLMQLDFDKIDTPQNAENIKRWVFEQNETVCSYYSPSGGVKALIRITIPTTKEQYIRLHNAVTEKYEETGFFDVATKNAVLPLFLSIDENILYRDYSQCIPWKLEKRIEIKHASLNDLPTTPNFNSKDQEYQYTKTIRILRHKIQGISDNGHPQVRSASLVLGSRVGAGYLDKQNAIIEISNFIKQNSYLSKGTRGYLDTAEWGINQGMNNPKYY